MARHPRNETPSAGSAEKDHEPIQLLSAERVAKLLDVSVRTLWRLRSAGKLPLPLRVGGSVRWHVGELHQWIEAGCPGIEQWEKTKELLNRKTRV